MNACNQYIRHRSPAEEKSIKTLCEFERAAPVVGIHRVTCLELVTLP